MIKLILILELIFLSESCNCIFEYKAAESNDIFADQICPISLADLMEASKNSELGNVGAEKLVRTSPTFQSFLALLS